MQSAALALTVTLAVANSIAAQTPATPMPADARCTQLRNLPLANATVTAAVLVPGGSDVAGAGLSPHQVRSLPAFCRVQVTDRPTSDSDIKIEIWLPAEHWNGSYRGLGNGGFAGMIGYGSIAAAVAEGYAASGSDAGHTGPDAAFALGHPEKVNDFGWRAVHDTAVETKAIAAAFYDRAPSHSYFTSCSDGGREALMEAQRFPADYDGILAGAPAYNWTALLSAFAADDHALMASPAAYLPASKIPAISDAVRAACDAQDGVKDGIVADPRACKFDPEVLACKQQDSARCLTPDQIATLKTIYAAKRDEQGHAVFPGFLPGAEDDPGGWAQWIVGKSLEAPSQIMFFGLGYFRNFVFEQPDWNVASFDFTRDYKLATTKTAAALNATDTNLAPFVSRGGHLILYHGWNDPAIPAESTVAYYDGLVATMGASPVDSAVRLYIVPGMLHCGGGPGATSFGEGGGPRGDAQHDIFTALEQWVEAGHAPGQLTATKFVADDPAKGVAMTRPLCPYPSAPQSIAGADSNSVSGFTCAIPKRPQARPAP